MAKRKHFPLTSALALTIHKSQGGTFDEILYEYSKSQSQELVNVALSWVTNIEKLYITTKTIILHSSFIIIEDKLHRLHLCCKNSIDCL